MSLKDFKKVGSNENYTSFKHPNGSWLRVAHKGISKEYKAKLDKLPAHPEEIEPAKMAEGGDVGEEKPWYVKAYDTVNNALSLPDEEAKPDPVREAIAPKRENRFTAEAPPLGAKQEEYKQEISKYPIPEAQQDYGGRQPQAATVSMAPEQPATPMEAEQVKPVEQEMPPQGAIQQGMPGDSDLAAQAASAKEAAAGYQKGFQDYHRENAHQLGAEDAAWQHDLQNGHVSPKTYSDLFAKRDTLGKIGMLFGMLVSGAGAGLAHQSNAVLDAMNKEIENDFNAQKISKENARNFLELHRQQALAKAQIKHTEAQAGLLGAQEKSALAEADINAQAAALMKMNRAALHKLVLDVQKMPQGPQKAQAEQALAMVSAGVDAKNFNIADIAAGKAAMAKMLGGGAGSGVNTTLLRTMPGMEGVASSIEQKNIPGVGMAQLPVPQGKRDELEAMNVLDYKAKDLLAYARQHKGSIDPAVRAVGAQKAEEMMNYYNNSIKGGVMTEGRLKWLDQQIKKNPTTIFQDILGNNARMNEIMESNAERRNLMLQNLGAPQTPPPKAGPKEGEVQKSKSGKPIVFKGGKWHYQ